MRNQTQVMPGFAIHSNPRRIGIMAELVGAGTLAPLVEAAVDTLESHGFGTMVISAGKSAQEELSAWDSLARSDCDGFIIHSDCLTNDQLARLISTRKNVVLANLNNVQAGTLAAAHLIKSGHRRIAMVTGPTYRCSVRYRSEGFMQALSQPISHGVHLQTLEAPFSTEGGANAMRMLLASDTNPTAVFFHSDQMAMGAMEACRKLGLRVPEDISILGCGDLDMAAHTTPGLCTVRQPLDNVGRYAANRLIKLVNGVSIKPASDAESESVEPQLVARQSVQNAQTDVAEARPATQTQISKRERECLEWAANGKTSWEISQILGVSESTIIYHLRNATRKLDAANRLHAVAKALKASLIDF